MHLADGPIAEREPAADPFYAVFECAREDFFGGFAVFSATQVERHGGGLGGFGADFFGEDELLGEFGRFGAGWVAGPHFIQEIHRNGAGQRGDRGERDTRRFGIVCEGF